METILKQILSEIQDMKTDIQGMKTEIQDMKTETQEMKTETQEMKTEIISLKEGQIRLEQKVDGIYKSVVRIEEGQPKDIFAILENIDRKLDTKELEINVLNKRIFKVETEIERL